MPPSVGSRGISSLIAALLLMVLAVSAGAIIYSYTMGYLGNLGGGGQTFGRMSIDSAVLTGEGLTAYIRNVGEGAVVLDRAYVDSTLVEGAGYSFEVNGLGTGDDAIAEGETGSVAISIPGGFESGRSYEFRLVDAGNAQLTFTARASVSGTGEEDWLGGWGKRVKMIVDHGDVDSDLSDFPMLVYLSSSSGCNNDDVSFVFDELGDDADRMKIAVTEGDGLTQCYVEVEGWDDGGEEAWLWVRVPSVNSSQDTVLYLYYDSGHADNTEYVGDPQSTPAQNVWSPKYSAVLHFNDDFDDSVDGDTPSNTPGAAFVAGKIADAGEFYDNGDEADYTAADALGGGGASDDDVGTFSFWMKGNEASYDYQADIGYTSGFIPANLDGGLNPYLRTYWGGWRFGGTGVVTLNEWHHVVVRWNAGTGFDVWVNGAPYNSYSAPRSIVVDKVTIGNYKNHGAYEANAIIDEVRFVDDVEVSDAWIKATYESERDHLIGFGSEEIA
jgi:hypothetical protein